MSFILGMLFFGIKAVFGFFALIVGLIGAGGFLFFGILAAIVVGAKAIGGDKWS